jgi:hypothetical protein
MIPLQSRSKVQPMSTNVYGKRRKRYSRGMLVGIGVTLVVALLAIGVFAAQKAGFSHAASVSQDGKITTINGLQNITQIGSATNILDNNGNPVTANSDPYKIVIVPNGFASPILKPGNLLVSNIGNDDHGITIPQFMQQTSTGKSINPPTAVMGPADMGFDKGKLLVANSTGNSVSILNADGTLNTTVTNPLFNGPWGLTIGNPKQGNNKKGLTSFFVANKLDGKIMRVDVTTPKGAATPTFNVVQIGQYNLLGGISKIDMHWLPKLKVGSQELKDVLVTINPANNSIDAFPHSSTLNAVTTPMTVFQGTPLNNPGGLAINPMNGDALVVNLNDNNLLEINMTTATVIGTKTVDPLVVDGQGNNSALFGVLAIKDDNGNLKVFFTDDNTNTLNVLSK